MEYVTNMGLFKYQITILQAQSPISGNTVLILKSHLSHWLEHKIEYQSEVSYLVEIMT